MKLSVLTVAFSVSALFETTIKYKEVGNLYGARNWIEYGLKQIKNELGWADFRMMDYSRIEKWREIVMSVYLMVSLQIENLPPHDNFLNKSKQTRKIAYQNIQKRPWWNQKVDGKTYLTT
ncbi:transposase [Synechocystis sp. PCC 6803]|uniref:Transposase n=1 Tax=Synechocystis sp. (strain ATCC 27184 / PCC 6803 / Kazusa) TaxID=1111708 RepID=P73915_SYNY3|nr:transposase [Synechocystis sp. PCC 6803]BAL29150.1 transposase [Synechocystis sp. PCC 6803 substr. GT-I]BAL32319.1 transposase [Synechocystis sp. PCC 6803 substr. PCC-N]BAL35488.1 transposase [Synechocystis sp. PCC 6803 substr. PCC-P]BAM51735.1 transposase [Synechocystis sp. PCC 6803] [Bacillus subtilis BEST7613]